MRVRPPLTQAVRRSARRGALAGLAFSAVLVGGFTLVGRAQGPGKMPFAPSPAPAAQGPGAAGAPGATTAAVPPSPTVRITLITVPSARKVLVFWGKRRLGLIAPHAPLIIQRPRDSGPLDLILKSEGYIPVQTRAFSFGDSKVAVRLTPIDQKKTLLGYREEVPPPAAPDGGVPAGAAASPGSPVPAPPPGTPPFQAPEAGAR